MFPNQNLIFGKPHKFYTNTVFVLFESDQYYVHKAEENILYVPMKVIFVPVG